jgi:hypothetical protein
MGAKMYAEHELCPRMIIEEHGTARSVPPGLIYH